MKKVLSTILTFSFLTFATVPKKAEAGFIILAATQEFVWEHKYETLDTFLAIGFPVALITTSLYMMSIPGMPFHNGTYIAGIVLLGEKIEDKRDDIKSSLLSRYPFIDDMNVIENLASSIIPRYHSAKDTQGNAMIMLSENEIIEATAPLDLSPEQMDELLHTLAY